MDIVTGFLLLFGLPALIIYGIIKIVKKSSKKVKDNFVQAKENINKWLQENNIEKVYDGLEYLTGHPDITESINMFFSIGISKDDIILFRTMPHYAILGKIPLKDVVNIEAQDKSRLESKLSALNLLAYGHAAASMMNTQKKVENHYVVVEWNDGKFKHNTVFSYLGKNSLAKSNELRSELIKAANKAP